MALTQPGYRSNYRCQYFYNKWGHSHYGKQQHVNITAMTIAPVMYGIQIPIPVTVRAGSIRLSDIRLNT